jgi:hypothetical protein
MVRDEEGSGVGLQERLARVKVNPDGERRAVLAEAEEESAGDPKGRRSIRGALDDPGQRQGQPSGDRKRYRPRSFLR